MNAIDFWLKVFGMFFIQMFAYVCIKGDIDLSMSIGVLILWFISCICEIIVFNKLLKRSGKNDL